MVDKQRSSRCLEGQSFPVEGLSLSFFSILAAQALFLW